MTPNTWREHPRIEAASSWIVAHATRLWGFVLVGIVLALSWHTLRGVHTQQVRAVLRALDARQLTLAGRSPSRPAYVVVPA